VARWGYVEAFGPTFPQHLHVSLHRDHRHSKGPYDLLRLNCAVDNHLAGKHAEARDIILAVVKHRQVSIKVIDRSRFLFHRNLAVDLRHPGGKYR